MDSTSDFLSILQTGCWPTSLIANLLPWDDLRQVTSSCAIRWKSLFALCRVWRMRCRCSALALSPICPSVPSTSPNNVTGCGWRAFVSQGREPGAARPKQKTAQLRREASKATLPACFFGERPPASQPSSRRCSDRKFVMLEILSTPWLLGR